MNTVQKSKQTEPDHPISFGGSRALGLCRTGWIAFSPKPRCPAHTEYPMFVDIGQSDGLNAWLHTRPDKIKALEKLTLNAVEKESSHECPVLSKTPVSPNPTDNSLDSWRSPRDSNYLKLDLHRLVLAVTGWHHKSPASVVQKVHRPKQISDTRCRKLDRLSPDQSVPAWGR